MVLTDPVQMPRTFPIENLGVPTPGTTTLNKPPDDILPPPPPLPTCNERPIESQSTDPDVVTVAPHMRFMRSHAFHEINSLCRAVDLMKGKTNALLRMLFESKRKREE